MRNQWRSENCLSLLGYNTNGFAHHRLEDIVEILHHLGYTLLAWTPDVHHLDITRCSETALREFKKQLQKFPLKIVVETGARFILDPWHKHQPTLLSPEERHRRQRLQFLEQSLAAAEYLEAEVVSFWSGVAPHDIEPDRLMTWLIEGCQELADRAQERGIRLAFEPEPGMFIETMTEFATLFQGVNHAHFGLTLDVGHCICTQELPISKLLMPWHDRLWNIHLDDMLPGIHDHLPLGAGELDFRDLMHGLRSLDYRGPISVELSRHSHQAVDLARETLRWLDRSLQDIS